MLNKLISTNLTLTDANLYGGISYNRDINPDNDFMYGCAASGSIEFTIDNSDSSHLRSNISLLILNFCDTALNGSNGRFSFINGSY